MTALEEALKWAASPLAAGMHDRVLHDEIIRLRECLTAIAERHIPDQPTDSGNESDYVRGCHTQLRRMAITALTPPATIPATVPAVPEVTATIEGTAP